MRCASGSGGGEGWKFFRTWFGSSFLLLFFCAPQVSAAEILLVHGAGTLKKGEERLVERLRNDWGHTVSTVNDTVVQVADAEGMDLVILSGSVDSNLLGDMFREAPVPIWLDVSYVDGYTHPVTVNVDNAGGRCAWQGGGAAVDGTGCSGSLGACPWALRDSAGNHGPGAGVCYGAAKEASFMRWFGEPGAPGDAAFIAIQCGCPAGTGCGDDGCGTQAHPVGCGCSPHATYPGTFQYRTCCSPIADLEAAYVTPCNPGLCSWPDKFKAYPRSVKTQCDASYSWQFHDNEGLLTCQQGGQPYNYTVTFWPK
jgi:hypothetical protein